MALEEDGRDVAPAKDVDLSEDMEQLKEHIEQITTALEESEAERGWRHGQRLKRWRKRESNSN